MMASSYECLKQIVIGALAIVTCLTWIGCNDSGGDGGGTGVAPASVTGTFVDSPVDGLRYTTTSNPGGGFTTGGGHFPCQPGDLVKFFLGTLQIGNSQLCSSDVVTAVSVLGVSTVTAPEVVNLSQLLLTLATSVSSNQITLPHTLPAGFNAALVPAFTNPNFDTAVEAALPSGTLLVSDAQAISQLQASLKMLTLTIINGGTVTSTPAGINCVAGAGICSYVFQTGTDVTLAAIGNGFTGWSGGSGSVNCTGTGPCSITMNTDSAVTAQFPAAPPPATLQLSISGSGSGTITCSANGAPFGACVGSYPGGTGLVLQGVASNGSTFTGWSNGTGNVSCTGTANCSMTLNANSTVTATFTLNSTQFQVTANTTSANGGGGTVQCSANGGAAGPCGSFQAGTLISVIPTPNNVSNFTGWTNGTGSITANCNNASGACNFTLTGPTTMVANFNRPIFTVVVNGIGSVSTNPAGINACTTNCSAAFDKGSSVLLTASATGFIGWSFGGCLATNTCQVTVDADTTVTANFVSPVAYLKASYITLGDNFGVSVALEANTLVIGAPSEHSGATGINGNPTDISAGESGAVYVFNKSGGVWSQQVYIKATNTGAGDDFGWSVALSGDTLVVGAPFEDSAATGVNGNQSDNTAPNSGAVYVFTRTGATWSQQAYLKASNTGAGDNFGRSVALAGDTLVVGAQGEASAAIGVNGNQADNSAGESGAVYVFTRTAGVWSQQAYLKASNTGASDHFGASVTLTGDTLAVGATDEASSATGINGNQSDNSLLGSGAVYVFTRAGGAWSQQAYLKASNTGLVDRFGWSVSASGDTLAVGALNEASAATGVNGNQASNTATGSGAVYVFTRTAGIWSQQAYLKASNTDILDQFGWSIALTGDTLAVGAQNEDSAATGINGNQTDRTATKSGAVYLFSRSGVTWSQKAYVKASNTDSEDSFGRSVALTSDTLAIGAPLEDSNGNPSINDLATRDSGAVYVYRTP